LIDGVPVGRETSLPREPRKSAGNSIMMIVATNLDVNTRQLWKIAKRTSLGLARTGSFSSNNSGDYSIAFTTSKLQIDKYIEQTNQPNPKKGDSFLNPIYKATVEATEEAIINALFKAETMKGRDGNIRYALPLDQVKEIFEKFGKPL
jgi:D-aminopeptidase